MKSTLRSAVLASSIASGLAVSEWGQCGGLQYTGSTVCDAGLSCMYQNPYYSQCLRSTATTTSQPGGTPTTSSTPPASTGYVKTSGQKFTLNGSTYTVVGSNAYWMAQLATDADITKAFNDLKNSGLTTLRTWGFNDVTSPGGTYYQLWSGSTGTLNTGSNGLGRFDTVVAAAKASGIRLIVALTNNWGDYGGMDVYVKQILGSSNHDLFYTDASVKAAYKKYINGFVSRYKNEPTIMAWELANEPRCKGATGAWTGNCNIGTITNWATEISAYIKSIDPNHLVGLGDEGFYNWSNGPNYPYQGSEGIDFDANLNHAASQKSINKPVILEEFGVTSDKVNTYTQWYSTIISSGLTGDLVWQAGSTVSTGQTANDGFTIYTGTPEYSLQTQHAAALKSRG